MVLKQVEWEYYTHKMIQSLQQFKAPQNQWLHLPWHLDCNKPTISFTMAFQWEAIFMRKLLLPTRRVEVKERAEVMRWSTGQSDTLTVRDSKGIERNLIIEFGQLTLSDIRGSVTHYDLQPVSAVQNSEAFANFFVNSLVSNSKAKMYTFISK